MDLEIPGFRFDAKDWSRKTSAALFHKLPPELRQDSSDPYFRARELEQVVETMLDEEYDVPQMRTLVPVEGYDPGAVDLVVQGMGRTGGNARPRGKGAQDLPLADVSSGETTVKPDENWLGCRYTDRELAAAARAGRPVDRDKMRAVQEDLEDLYDLQLRFGLPDANTTGLLNSHAPTAMTTGDWDDPTTTNAEILADFAEQHELFRAGNPRHRLPNTVRWDGDTHARMTAPISADASLTGGVSLLSILQARYSYIDFGVLDVLDTAGTGVSPYTGLGGIPLMIMYRKDRMVVRGWEARTPTPDPAHEGIGGIFTVPFRQWCFQGVLWLRPLEGRTFTNHHT